MMQKSSLLRSVLKSRASLSRSNQWLPQLLCEHSRNFSTQKEGVDPASDPFFQTPKQGLVYGRLTGIGRNALKSDLIHLFEGCNLTSQDIKVDYNRAYASVGMVLQFPSLPAFDTAFRVLTRKGRLYRLEKVDRGQWDLLKPYDGKDLLIQGIPRNATLEDVERFLCGCNYDASNIQVFTRPGFPDPIRLALIHFPTQIEAMNAFHAKSRSFCLNNPISVRVLQ